MLQARIIRIGNSQGVRLPKPLLEQAGITDDVQLAVTDGAIVISPANPPRAGWQAAFEQAAAAGTDAPLAEFPSNDWDRTEWQW